MEDPIESIAARNRPSSKVDYVYQTLREAIVSGELQPGEPIVQTDIAARLGVSPIPVREAIRRLIAEGLVVQEPHRSSRVAPLSPRALNEILIIRMHLEALAAREAAPHVTPQDLDDLRQIVRRMDEAIQRDDMPEYGRLNKQFHLRLYQCCPYPLLVRMIQELWDNSDRYRSRTMFGSIPNLAARSQREHKRMLKLLEARDAEGLARVMERHKRAARTAFVEFLTREERGEADRAGETQTAPANHPTEHPSTKEAQR